MKNILYIAAIMLLVACGGKTNPSQSAGNNGAPESQADNSTSTVRMHTTAGVIELRLYDGTPKHRDNFLKLVNEDRLDSLLFHRVIKDFMIQGGDPDSKNAPAGAALGSGGLGYTVEAEIMPDKYFHRRGALAAARTGDAINPTKASSSCQFYIVWGTQYTVEQLAGYKEQYKRMTGKDLLFTPEQVDAYTTVGGTPFLDGEYTVFGEVVSGLDVVEKIQDAACDRSDRPFDDIRILNVEIVE